MSRAGRTLLLIAGVLTAPAVHADFLDWWLTPDQQGQRLLEQGDAAEAAKRFTTPDRIGAALYAARDFEGAAAVFGRQRGPEGAYNRGNALVLLGRYDEAIASYDAALEDRPDWDAARENRAIAVARKAALSPPNDGSEGTDGMLGADETVIDDSPENAGKGQDVEIQAQEQGGDEAALRAMWLRRVQTDPADFLQAKFNNQLRNREARPDDSPGEGG